MLQSKALELLKTNNNIFLTGPPGSGKSYLTQQYIEWLLDNGKIPAITASTGIAAVPLGGMTLHSFAGIRDDSKITDDDMEGILQNPWVRKRIKETEILIIDEVSMISASMLDIVSTICMQARGDSRPFGGIQVIAVGDFFQLPPVKGRYAFQADTWKQANFVPCYLHEQHRQSEPEFIRILSHVRTGTPLSEEDRQLLRSRMIEDASTVSCKLRLETHNRDVDAINERRLQLHPGTVERFIMTESGNEKIIPLLKKSCLSPERLLLKAGVPVIFTKNDKDQRWVNGSQGTVIECNDGKVTVELQNGARVEVEPVDWEKAEGYGRNKRVIASITQIPLRLGWAITVHKSQGMTLDSAIIDVTKAFAPGQGYVAISRVRSLQKIYFQGKLTRGVFAIDPLVQEADALFQERGEYVEK